METILYLSVTGGKIKATNAIEILSKSKNWYRCSFSFDSTWEGLTRTAVFSNDKKSGTGQTLAADNTCYIPSCVLQEPGYLYIGVVHNAVLADGTLETLPTQWTFVTVREGVDTGTVIPPPEENVYETILTNTIRALTYAADVEERANAGDFTATVALGSVTTGESGSDAVITNSGTAQNAVLNFTLPRGIQGIQGIQGVQGETGARGLAGLNWLGAYSAATSYAADDAVSYNGSSYICVQASTGNVPTNTGYWQLLAAKGTDGAGAGDMSASVYDPAGVAGDAFAMDNMAEGTVNKIFTAAERTKLTGIAEGAEVNVNADWNASSGDAQILNKPTSFTPAAHTHNASDVTDFDTEVANNTDVAANTSARHTHVNATALAAVSGTNTGDQILYLQDAGNGFALNNGSSRPTLGTKAVDLSYTDNNTLGATGDYAYTEGQYATAGGSCSHAEGSFTTAGGSCAHSEGRYSEANGNYSHAEGQSEANGKSSHSEGEWTQADGNYAHAEGNSTTADGASSHAEGHKNNAFAEASHAEGCGTNVFGTYSHAEGYDTGCITNSSHAEGMYTLAGNGTIYKITAYDNNADTITLDNVTGLSAGDTLYIKISNAYLMSGFPISAINGFVVSLGDSPYITSGWVYAVKVLTTQVTAHAEGNNSLAVGNYCHAQNEFTIAKGKNQTAIGKYNVAQGTPDSIASTDHAFIIGNGTADGSRSNALTVDWAGNVNLAGGASYKINGAAHTHNIAEDTTPQLGGELDCNAHTIGCDEYDNGDSGTSKTIDWRLGNHQKVTMTGNCIFTFTAPTKPCMLSLRLIQDATGSRTITLPTLKRVGGTAFTWSTAASAIDILSIYYDGTNYYGQNALAWS